MSIILARHAVADRNHPKGKVAQARPGRSLGHSRCAVWGVCGANVQTCCT